VALFGTVLWENRKAPASGEWVRTFAIITTDATEMRDSDGHISGADDHPNGRSS
jgi:hypothetical protein